MQLIFPVSYCRYNREHADQIFILFLPICTATATVNALCNDRDTLLDVI